MWLAQRWIWWILLLPACVMTYKRDNGSWQSAELLQNLHEFLNLRWYWEPQGVSAKLAKGCYKPQTTFVKHLCRPKRLLPLAHLKWSWVFHCPPQPGRDRVFALNRICLLSKRARFLCPLEGLGFHTKKKWGFCPYSQKTEEQEMFRLSLQPMHYRDFWNVWAQEHPGEWS